MQNKINVTRSSMPPFDEYIDEIRDLWDSRHLSNMGEKHQRLEAALKAYLGVPNVTLFANGHLALEAALAALALPKDGEVITTPFTFASTTHAILRCGLVPVFCDINSTDYTIDAEKIEALITEKTVAIMPVHVYGNLCDTEAIRRIAEKHGLRVIYDAAHAFGVTSSGVGAAHFGDISMFSFHATQVFHTIEGGALCYANDELKEKLNAMKNFGIRGAADVPYAGGNAKMSEFHAAMGICNLRHLDEEMAKRQKVTERYRARLSGIPGIRSYRPKPGIKENYAYFPVVFDGYKWTRDEVYERLGAAGISARKYFYPLTSSFDPYLKLPTAGAAHTPVAAYIADRVLCLPLYADLSVSEADGICDLILGE